MIINDTISKRLIVIAISYLLFILCSCSSDKKLIHELKSFQNGKNFNEEKIKQLINDIDIPVDSRETPESLIWATKNSTKKVLDLFWDSGFDKMLIDPDTGYTLFETALLNGNIEAASTFNYSEEYLYLEEVIRKSLESELYQVGTFILDQSRYSNSLNKAYIKSLETELLAPLLRYLIDMNEIELASFFYDLDFIDLIKDDKTFNTSEINSQLLLSVVLWHNSQYSTYNKTAECYRIGKSFSEVLLANGADPYTKVELGKYGIENLTEEFSIFELAIYRNNLAVVEQILVNYEIPDEINHLAVIEVTEPIFNILADYGYNFLGYPEITDYVEENNCRLRDHMINKGLLQFTEIDILPDVTTPNSNIDSWVKLFFSIANNIQNDEYEKEKLISNLEQIQKNGRLEEVLYAVIQSMRSESYRYNRNYYSIYSDTLEETDILRWFLSAGVDLNMVVELPMLLTVKYITPFQIAYENDDLELIDNMLNSGYIGSVYDLIDCIDDKNWKLCDSLVENGTDINSIIKDAIGDEYGTVSYYSVLHLAAQKGDIESIIYLLENGADPNILLENVNYTYGNLHIFNENIDPKDVTINDLTIEISMNILGYSVFFESIEVVEILKNYGAENPVYEINLNNLRNDSLTKIDQNYYMNIQETYLGYPVYETLLPLDEYRRVISEY